jgi:hypothetical protein
MITLVKFIVNKRETEGGNNPVITKTLGKTGVVHWSTATRKKLMPKEEEFWFVNIMKEKGAGTPHGLFVLEPLERVRLSQRTVGEPDIIHMIPGTYDLERVDNVLLLHPHTNWYPERLGPNWICGLSIRKSLFQRYRTDDTYNVNSIVVVFDRTSNWPREALHVSAEASSAPPVNDLEKAT